MKRVNDWCFKLDMFIVTDFISLVWQKNNYSYLCLLVIYFSLKIMARVCMFIVTNDQCFIINLNNHFWEVMSYSQ